MTESTRHFDLLYGKDKNNKIKQWSIQVENKGEMSLVIYSYGQLGGKRTECSLTVSKGKNIGKRNETTHFEQACLEAQSKWTKKRDIERYTTNLAELQEQTNQEQTISSTLPKLPMLAQEYKKNSHKVKFPVVIQPKLDGYRLTFNPENQKVYSRTGKEFTILYNTELYKELSKQKLYLDGELYVHSNSFKFENYGILRKTKQLTKEESELLETIEYHVYDIIDETLTYTERQKLLESTFENNNQKIKVVKGTLCHSPDEIASYHQQFVCEGYEGSMVRNLDAKYKCKFRSYDLLKNKDFDDNEFEIVDFTFEKDTSGQNEHLVVWTCKTGSGETFNIRPKGTEEERKNLYKRAHEFKGQKLWVQYFGLTDLGVPRFPSTKTDSYLGYIRNTEL